ncbi:hypothetical protein GIB67_018868 [Kingdonia uniflora]|uniref:Uncharacterized protein n=1 Tax=Kingdonia uniflora TaxID=39325 RepID=A0A7J7MZI5_9MAGN|nr:hypothetical protein GIB67_018868 [Kingdonia uniflora]
MRGLFLDQIGSEIEVFRIFPIFFGTRKPVPIRSDFFRNCQNKSESEIFRNFQNFRISGIRNKIRNFRNKFRIFRKIRINFEFSE